MLSMTSWFAFWSAFNLVITLAQGDPTDWVNIDYVVQQSASYRNARSMITSDSQTAITHSADSSSRSRPWSVTNSQQVLPPSGDNHDYLSWAPYHWPNCNWCNNAGRNHLAHSGGNDQAPPLNRSSTLPPNFDGNREWEEDLGIEQGPVVSISQPQGISTAPISHDRTPTVNPPLPTAPPSNTLVLPMTPKFASTTTGGPGDRNSPGPAQNAAKTSRTSCVPSPTGTVPPSATWTTCPYVTHDGQVNPDVRTLNSPGAITGASQAIISNAIAYTLSRSSIYSQNTVQFIDVFFLDPTTRMNPNVKYGQIVRGPGIKGSTGTFTGVLDLRGLVKVVNAISLMNASGSPDWSNARDERMASWMSQYAAWLTGSEIGKMAGSRPNNHGSFYVSQVAVAKMLGRDNEGAAVALQRYFNTQFLDQVAKSGEQPFEAVRTRPYHYRCFNLEAMITNAKLGDQLGLNFWTARSRYGATIQTATDFIMATSPKNEDVNEVLPHVATVAAAYGDPTGKYASFLKSKMPNYQSRPFWFYDQTAALRNSPAGTGKKRSILWAREDKSADVVTEPMTKFECPAIFGRLLNVEIDNGIFVSCDQLKPYYEAAVPPV